MGESNPQRIKIPWPSNNVLLLAAMRGHLDDKWAYIFQAAPYGDERVVRYYIGKGQAMLPYTAELTAILIVSFCNNTYVLSILMRN